jgi:hypothetical protein
VVFAGLEDDGDEAGISKSVNGSPTPNLAAADQPRAKVLTVESRELPDDTVLAASAGPTTPHKRVK